MNNQPYDSGICMLTKERTLVFLWAALLCGICVLGLTACGADSGPSPGSLTIANSSLPEGAVNQPYSASLTPGGGTPPYTWSVSPALPNGLNLDPATGAITGTPTTQGTTTHTFSVHDNSVPAQAVQQTLNLTVAPPAGTLTITTTSLPNGTVGVPYSRPVQATGGSGTFTWTISSGQLPQNLSFDPNTGVVSGTPTTPGTSSFTVRVADTAGQSDTQPLSITITAIPPPPMPPSITTTSLPNGDVDVPYSQPVQATGGTGALAWNIVGGALPAGLTLNLANGAISGTPTVAGTSLFTVRVQDAAGLSAFQALSITINPPAPPRITTMTLPTGTIGQLYSQPVQATGGTGARIWSIIAGSLPAGLNLDAATGVISGTPVVPGTSSFTVRVQDAAGQSDQQALSITINLSSPPHITTTSLAGGTVGQPYNETLTATGGIGALIWTVSGGSLPPGVNLDPTTGLFSGTPTNAGTANFTVRVADSLGQSDTQSLAIVISAGLSITTNSLPDAQVGKKYNKTMQRSGGVAPFTWSVAPVLPAGLSLDSATGQITGSPAERTDGDYTLTFFVQDSSIPTPQSNSRTLTLKIKK